MEHLDLEGVLTATPTNWHFPALDQQDAIFLSNSRQMLEPILEEAEDEEYDSQNSWHQYENSTNFWSSADSETNAVLKIELNKDPDSISERDFVCPAKRARRSDEFLIGGATTTQQLPMSNSNVSGSGGGSLDDTVLLRRNQRWMNAAEYNDTNSNSLERFLTYEATTRDSWGQAQRGSTGSRRFDDFYSDTDSLSYNSLSRSSSLIQFESLERQLLLQEQHASMSSLGNSSPSLLSFDGSVTQNTSTTTFVENGASNSGSNSGNNSRRGSQSSLLKRFESTDGRLHQTYFDLDKLSFDDERNVLFGSASKTNMLEATLGEVKSDSESSTSSSTGSSSGNSILDASKSYAADSTSMDDCLEHVCSKSSERIAAFQQQRGGGKNSAENLSEDSGYGEPSTLRRSKSKSIPKSFEKFCEEDEEYQQLEYEIENTINAQNKHSKNSTITSTIPCAAIATATGAFDVCQAPKINDASVVSEYTTREIACTVFDEEDDDALALQPLPDDSPESPTKTCHSLNRVKNSPTRELHEQRNRSLAHSPSPVSSVGSSSSRSSVTSAETCASAASFTWLPTEQKQLSQPKHTLANFDAIQRNSLPDIRDACGSGESPTKFSNQAVAIDINSNGLEQLKSKVASTVREVDNYRSTSTRRKSYESRSDVETTPEARKRGVGGDGECGDYSNNARKIYSVPDELNSLGRRKRSTKYKYSKIVGKTNSLSSSAEEVDGSDAQEETDEYYDFFDDFSVKASRSCSWTERRACNLQKFESFEKNRRHIVEPQSLGYINASYQDLTQLDYTNNCQNKAQYKRGCGKMELSKLEKRKSSGDYESLICKGNFLLDELSEIYDKNASILNDKPISDSENLLDDAVEEPLEVCLYSSPKPPPRQQKYSNASYSDVETETPVEQIQHVQLTIRMPPTRQKSGRHSEATNSLVSEVTPTFGTFGKTTFDQDPTNLRTNYAQSLEKCNFDPKEISTTDLSKARSIPKRRFQTQATTTKKRNLVSSTPNLNAFDPRADEIEDDIYVTSAYTSMHQLPQGVNAQKPLGILLPTGSRTSFSKEVSFCPVVSKYSWQEQSSEECNEPTMSNDVQDKLDDSGVVKMWGDENVEANDDEEDTDDELLDNADATVIYNTKENEMIATRFNEENSQTATTAQQVREEQTPATMEQVRVTVIVKENNTESAKFIVKERNECTPQIGEHNKTSHEAAIVEKQQQPEAATTTLLNNIEVASPVRNDVVAVSEVSHKSTIDNETRNLTEQRPVVVSETESNTSISSRNGQTRPLSIQLPILSEPPTNRAHHILYASHQMLNSLQRREQLENAAISESENHEKKKKSGSGGGTKFFKNSLTKNLNMYHYNDEHDAVAAGLGATSKPPLGNNNNNNNGCGGISTLLKPKFKTDEKHPNSKNFLARFANGFRFSLRRNKKKQKEQQLAAAQIGGNASSDIAVVNKASTLPQTNGLQNTTGSRAVNQPTNTTTSLSSSQKAATLTIGAKPIGKQHVLPHFLQSTGTTKVTGKPPIPRQQQPPPPPPRSSVLQSAGPHAQQQQQMTINATNFSNKATPKANSQFYTDADFLDAERGDTCNRYDDFKNQLNTGMQQPTTITLPPHDTAGVGLITDASSPSRASVMQKTQMFNQLMQSGNNCGEAAAAAGCKIGLIETNLDTHETVISGKTRSLMDIGPMQQQSRYKYGGGKRLNASGVGGGVGVHGARGAYGNINDIGDDEIDYDADDDDEQRSGGVVLKSGNNGTHIASVRRPHKSMEFLLDKENQKNVLPPENELQKSHEHNPAALSEHQLRIQASLQRLNIPEWFRQYNQNTARSPDGAAGSNAYRPGNFTRKRTTESGRWAGLNSKTTSLSSLGSQRSDRSPLLLSPSAHSHHGGQSAVGHHHHHHQHSGAGGTGAYGTGGPGAFSRWSTSHLNSTQTSPNVSQRGSFTRGVPINSSFVSVASGQNSGVLRNSYRQPYLGWRSQEKLSQRTAHERLASSLLAQQQQQRVAPTTNGRVVGDKLQPITPEIQSSIKEVTSAIVHYVNDQTNQQRSRSTSPNSRKCWLESSFVGTRPLDSPQTPIIENTATTFSGAAAAAATSLNYNSNNFNNSSNYNQNIITSYRNNQTIRPGEAVVGAEATTTTTTTGVTTNADVLRRMNGLSRVSGECTILV